MRTDTRKSRPALTTLVAAALVLLALEVGTRVVEPRVVPPTRWGNLGTDLRFAQMEALSSDGDVDIVFLGSSMVEVGIDPEEFVVASPWAESAFNASLSASSPRLLEAWASDVVFPLLSPSVVVIGVSSRELNDNGITQQRVYDRYIESRGRADYLGNATFGQAVELAAESLSMLYRLRDRIRSPHGFIGSLTSDEPQYLGISKFGHNTLRATDEYRFSTGFREHTANQALYDFATGGQELKALERIINTATARGAKVYLVNMPVFEADYLPLHPRGGQDYRAFLANFADFDAHDVVWVDAAAPFPQDPTLFADPVHLNARGAAALEGWLAGLIERP